MENLSQSKKIKWIILIVIFVIVVGGVLIVGYYWGFSVGQKAALKAGGKTPVINPFDAVKTNPLEGQGYTNPFKGVRLNPFK
ncbi:MAG: hypothetical protein ACOZAL_01955 [Patescibacteria group bacterium]